PLSGATAPPTRYTAARGRDQGPSRPSPRTPRRGRGTLPGSACRDANAPDPAAVAGSSRRRSARPIREAAEPAEDTASGGHEAAECGVADRQQWTGHLLVDGVPSGVAGEVGNPLCLLHGGSLHDAPW